MKTKFFLATILFLSLATKSQACDHQTSRAEINLILRNTLLHYFPLLKKVNIQLRENNTEGYYFHAKPDIASLLKKKSERIYFVEFNPDLYDCAPPASAISAILAHELEHIVDYENRNSLEIGGLGLSYASNKLRAKYERQTDMKVLYKGLAEGLLQYRNWVYQQLTPSQIKTKRKLYLTPEEIAQFIKDTEQ